MIDFEKRLDGLREELDSLPKYEGRTPSVDFVNLSGRPKEGERRAVISDRFGTIPLDVLEVFSEVTAITLRWTTIESDGKYLWHSDGNFALDGFLGAIAAIQLAEDASVESEKLHRWMKIYLDQGFLQIGQIYATPILLRFEGESHGLYMLYDPHKGPERLYTKLPEFLDCMLQARGMGEFPLYLTENFPRYMESFRYTGFFEKVTRLFPDADLSGFRHREQCDFQESTVVVHGRLNYVNRITQAFANMPKGATFQRWHPEADIHIIPGDCTAMWYWQLLYKVKFSDELEAFYTENYKLEICWTLDERIKARFDFPCLDDVFPKQHAPEYYGLSPDDEPHLVGKYVFYTDQYNDMLVQFEGDGRCTFHLLYLEADDYATHYITDDFDWLFTQLLNARGMYWWNYFLVFEPSAGDQRYQQFHRQMREYFPDADMSLYPDPAGL